MTKKLSLAFYTLLIAVFLSTFSTIIFAQKSESVKTEQSIKSCSGEKFVMPSSIAVGDEAFADFIKVASLSGGGKKKCFSRAVK